MFFIWVAWFMLLFRVFADIFRRQDLSGWGKTGWLIFTIILPFLGVFIYLITQGSRDDRAEPRAAGRSASRVRRLRAGNRPAAEARRPRSPRPSSSSNSGAITQEEFQTLKAKAPAA